ncbi:MAG: hypothetical protein CL916_08615 [Deltaproteobacteria bacterium]|nr:hypothetical protein [Deltaproteobacteria bacterium]
MAGVSHNTPTDYFRKAVIVTILLGIVIGINYYVPHGGSKAALIALGFVILAAYLIGELVEIIKLPHITGYLLAGLFLGPSLAHTLHDLYPGLHLIPPFDHGLINQDVINNLGVLDTLALPLICLTAGGALNPKEIWSAIRPIMGVLFGQIITMFVGMLALVYCLSGVIPGVQIDAFVGLSIPALLSIGGLVAAISLATSDAATIAIVVSAKAKGPMTTNVISVAVLKDIVVVIAFAAMTTLAMGSLGLEGGESLGKSIQLIFLSALLGIVLGGVIHLYLKYVKEEVLLFLTALIYTVSFVSDFFHLESALMFIAAGFVAKNWSAYGDELISEVERLSAPVFVVFFTLAGAQLHLDVLAKMAVVALLLAGVRALAFFIGVRLGSIVSGADEGTRKYAWMGFVSQAGLAITLAKGMPGTYGAELGGALFSFILGGVAINEVIGPAMLQSALGLAGELPNSENEESQRSSSQEGGWFLPEHVNPEILTICSDVQSYLREMVAQLQTVIEEQRLQPLEQCKGKKSALAEFSKTTTISLWDSASLLREIEAFSSTLKDQLLVPYESDSFVKRPTNGRLKQFLLFLQKKRISMTGEKRLINPRNISRVYLDTHCAKEVGRFLQAQIQFDITLGKALRDNNENDVQDCIQRFRSAMALFERSIIKHHRQLCFDLVHINTFLLPSRTLQSSFDLRNDVVRILCFEMYQARPKLQNLLSYYLYEQQVTCIRDEIHTVLKKKTEERLQKIDDFVLLQEKYLEQVNVLSERHDMSSLSKVIQNNQQSFAQIQEVLSQKESFLLSSLDIVPLHIERPKTMLTEHIDDVTAITFKRTIGYNHILSFIRNRIEPRFYSRFDSVASQMKRLETLIQEQLEIVHHAQKGEDSQEMLRDPIRRLSYRFATQLETREKGLSLIWSKENDMLTGEFSAMCSDFTDFDDLYLQAKPILDVFRDFFWRGSQRFQDWAKSIKKPLKEDPIAYWKPTQSAYMRLFEKGMYEAANVQPSRQILKKKILEAMDVPGLHVLLGSYEESCSLVESVHWRQKDIVVFQFQTKQENDFIARAGQINILMGIRWLFRFVGEDSPLEQWARHLMEHPEQTWIVVEDPHVWDIMSENYFLSDLAVHRWELSDLSCEELAEVILARHQLSGFDIVYPDHLSLNFMVRWYEENPKNRFFAYLHEQSRGDIHEAFLLWMTCLERIDEKEGQFVMQIGQHNLPSVLENISDSHLLLLRQMLQYGVLSLSLVQDFFCCSEEKATAWLSFLRKEHLVFEQNGYWSLVPTVRFSLIRVLKKRGWL